MGKQSPVQRLLASGYFDPRTRVIIAVTVNGSVEVLMDGIITKQDITPDSKAGKSMLTITGLDLTALMDFIDLTGIPYPGLPEFLIVEAILAKYAVLGVIPLALPASIPNFENPLDNFVKQQGTDYRFVLALAQLTGAVFYLDPGPKPGASLAYWGPDISKMFGGVQPALSIDFDGTTNIDSLSFSYDGTLATQYFVTIVEPNTKIPIPIPVPNIDLLKAPLGRHAPTPLRSENLKPTANGAQRARPSWRSAPCSRPPMSSAGAAAGRASVWPRVQGAAARRRARRRRLLRRPVLREDRVAQHQARSIQAELQPGARRAGIRQCHR